MTKTSKSSVKAGSEIFVPLNKLKKSPHNVRKMPHTQADIEALAASIAANGLLQNLVVQAECKDGKPTGNYLVNVGEGRRLALLLRAKRKEIQKDEPVRCLVGEAARAHEASLAENVIRSGMHPADEYEAFALLHTGKGLPAEDIAARFGVTPAVVRQRLKLAAVSPRLMQAYRADDMTLEQLMAFTITDDHARQEEVWSGLGWDKSARAIRRMLTEGQVEMDDRRAVFVGAQAYEDAGGVIVRDLFDADNGGYFADAALLDRLVLVKLDREAEAVRAEGWAWVEVMPAFDHSAAADMRRVYPHPVPPKSEDEAEIEALQTQYDELAAEIEHAETEEESEEAQRRFAEVEQRLEVLTGAEVFDPEDIARGGAFVALGHDGGGRIERGFIRKADEAASAREGQGADAEARPDERRGLSDALMADLTAHRTMALREAVAGNPDVALLAVTHALAAETFHRASRVSCLEISVRSETLSRHAPGIDDTAAGRAWQERNAKLAAQLPGEPQELWSALAAMKRSQLLEVLAHCAALTVNAVVPDRKRIPPTQNHAQALAQAISLDMSQHWQPTAANYLGRVSKPLILEAVREGVSEGEATNIADMKKGAMAEAAERLLAAKGWLPTPLRLTA
jgi:ParB family chromosome partitioning protein